MVRAIGKSDEIKGGGNAASASSPGERLEEKRQFNVLVSGENGDEVVKLKDVSNVSGAPPGELGPREGAEVLPIDDQLAITGAVDPRNHVEEGGLSGARGPHEGEKLTLWNLETEMVQGRDEVGPLPEGLGEVAQLNGGGHGGGS